MKLLERAILGIIRKPTKSIIILLTSLIVMNILSSFFNVYHSIQSLTNEMNQMIQPTVMIERPTSSIKIDEDLNYVTIDEKSRESYFELKKAYNEIEQLEEVNYSDIGVESTLFLEGMEDYAINHNIPLDDTKYFNISTLGIRNYDSYMFKNDIYEIIEGRNFTREEIDNNQNVIILNRNVNICVDNKIRLPQVGDKIKLSTRILKDDINDYYQASSTLEDEDIKYFNNKYSKLLYETQVYEFEVIGIYNNKNRIDAFFQPEAIIPYQISEDIFNTYYERLMELEEMHLINSVNRDNHRFNRYTRTNYYSCFELNESSEIETFREKVDEIFDKYKIENYEISFGNDTYLKVVGPFLSIQSISNTVIILSLFIGFVVFSLLSIILVKDKRKEIGVLLTLGETKKNIVKQMLLEFVLIISLASFLSILTYKSFSTTLQNNLLKDYNQTQFEIEDEMVMGNIREDELFKDFEIKLATSNNVLITIISAGFVLITCSISTLFVLKMNPKDILM